MFPYVLTQHRMCIVDQIGRTIHLIVQGSKFREGAGGNPIK
jgi:hypothetical protein